MILEVSELSFSYTKVAPLFENVSFTLHKGQVLSLLGANGVGKSTLFNCIANLVKPDSGAIRLNGEDTNKLNLRDVAKTVGYVPQTHVPAYGYAVRDFVVMGRAPHLGTFKQPGKEDFSLADDAMEKLGISNLADRPYTQLSGGERQLATIARVIVQQPELILLDEPTNHLDYGNQLRTLSLVNSLVNDGFGVLITSHNPDHVILLGGRVGILDNSGIFTVGDSYEILTQNRLRALYNSNLYLAYVKEAQRYVCVPGSI